MFLFLHPIFLFTIGTFIGLSPYIFGSKYFENYGAFVHTNEILYVYLVGYFMFSIGVIVSALTTKRKFVQKIIRKKDLNILITLLLLVSILFFIKIIQTYGTLPLLAILLGSESIEFINNIQKEVGGGLFGVFFLMVFMLIILFPYSVINRNSSKFNKYLFRFHFLLLLIYTTYSGKRQFLFVFFTYTIVYLLFYYRNTGNKQLLKKIKRTAVIGLLIILTIFSLIGYLRESGNNEDISFIDPIVHYASLPYMNLSNIIIKSASNSDAYTLDAFLETSFGDLPTFIKKIFFSQTHTLDMPLIEKTSPSTVYGEVFWNFGYLGIIVFMFGVGFVIGKFYYKAKSNNMVFITFYALTVWPMLSIHTYNHFKNFMFLILPLLFVLVGVKIYSAIPKKRIMFVTPA
jgi:oligosaccharide repeat unit polymerase